MKVSVFTPSHDTRYLSEAYQSLKAQMHKDWEWIILLNGEGAYTVPYSATDDRVRVIIAPEKLNGNIGALKRYACEAATGDVLVELDHDDLLASGCLTWIVKMLTDKPDVGFVYSHTGRFTDDGKRPEPYDSAYGWSEQLSVWVDGREVWCQPSFKTTPQSLARIWYAPDHVRAWRRDVYWLAGGHNADLAVCDDYDLLLRTYLITEFELIPLVLYLYRVGQNTSLNNETIQSEQFRIGHEYRVKIAETWARRKGLALLDLCSGPEPAEGYVGVDILHQKPATLPTFLRDAKPGDVIRADLSVRFPFSDNEVGVLRAQDALEHLTNKLHTIREAHRVLCHGGWFFSDTPSTDGRGAFQDPTHMTYWNSNSFWYYTSEQHRKFVSDAPHFQMWHIDNIYYSDWHKLHNIPYVRAHVSAIKDGPRLPGPYDFRP